MSLRGISISTSKLEEGKQKVESEIDKYLQKCNLTQPIYASSQQFSKHISNNISFLASLLNIWPKTKTGYFSRSHKDLSAWLTKHTKDARFQKPEVSQWFADFFSLVRAESLNKFFQQVEKHMYQNTLTPSWRLMGADTGRITTSEPGLHSTPRDRIARSIIVPTDTNNVFVIADYKTIELVIQAVLAQEPTMLQVLKNQKDLHTYLAAQIQRKSYDELICLKTTDPAAYKNMRNPMKAVNFGMIYVMGAQTLWNKLLTQGIALNFSEAQHYHTTWKNTFPQIQKYQQFCENFFNTNTHVLPPLTGFKYITSVGGRIRRPEILLVKNKLDNAQHVRNVLNKTQIVNFPIQATCTDFLKTSLRLLYHFISTGVLKASIVLTAHDEIVLECEDKNAPQTQQLLQNVMIVAAHHILQSPQTIIGVDSAIGHSWEDKP
uniref:DNA-directed DNA polymerase family A palm domain-containing protein n=1 Tax=Pseudocodium devriesii TaxID=453070 RepID=A0A386B0Y6_9CHLO|nr:hypothetical protein [Pseudocodium devriesii]AYC65361.1 hypothetical protein [Pseudocodium devriesii]